jgi:hypothetical protein
MILLFKIGICLIIALICYLLNILVCIKIMKAKTNNYLDIGNITVISYLFLFIAIMFSGAILLY